MDDLHSSKNKNNRVKKNNLFDPLGHLGKSHKKTPPGIPDGNGLMAKSATRGTAPSPVLVKKTAEKGGFIVKSIPSGSYNVTCSKSGYADQTAILSVVDGELSELKLQLAKN